MQTGRVIPCHAGLAIVVDHDAPAGIVAAFALDRRWAPAARLDLARRLDANSAAGGNHGVVDAHASHDQFFPRRMLEIAPGDTSNKCALHHPSATTALRHPSISYTQLEAIYTPFQVWLVRTRCGPLTRGVFAFCTFFEYRCCVINGNILRCFHNACGFLIDDLIEAGARATSDINA